MTKNFFRFNSSIIRHKACTQIAHILFGRLKYKVVVSREFDINKDTTKICRKATCMRTSVSNPPIKITKSKIPSTKIVLKKQCREKTIPHKHFWLWDTLEENIAEGWTVVSLRNWAYSLLYNCENTSQLSHKSRVLHTLNMCAYGVYKRGGARSSHYFALFQ